MIKLKISDILKMAKTVEKNGANPKKLILVIQPADPDAKVIVMEDRK